MRSVGSVWCLAAGLGLAACTARPETKSGLSTLEPDASEPPPHYHDYPDIPPDELGGATSAGSNDVNSYDAQFLTDAALPEQCPVSEMPPAAPPPRIRSGPPITNYIPPEIIMRPIRARAACFRGCYQAGLARNAKLAGRVAVRFVIDTDGWVRRTRIDRDELGDAEVADCIRRAFVGLRYAEPGDQITVVYPVVFAPAQ